MNRWIAAALIALMLTLSAIPALAGGSGILPVRCRVGKVYVVKYVRYVPAGCYRLR
jgi:hypothetical protein